MSFLASFGRRIVDGYLLVMARRLMELSIRTLPRRISGLTTMEMAIYLVMHGEKISGGFSSMVQSKVAQVRG